MAARRESQEFARAGGLVESFIAADMLGQKADFRSIEERQGQRVGREQVAEFEPGKAVNAHRKATAGSRAGAIARRTGRGAGRAG